MSSLPPAALAELRSSLERLREALRAESAAEAKEVATSPEDRGEDITPSQHPADVASDLERREMMLSERLAVARELVEVEAALARMDEGTYGICVDCGRAIPRDRLEARPQARRDIECERRLARR